jgi:hypothetical protein
MAARQNSIAAAQQYSRNAPFAAQQQTSRNWLAES